MATCPHCYSEIPDEASVCRFCGHNVSTPARRRHPEIAFLGLLLAAIGACLLFGGMASPLPGIGIGFLLFGIVLIIVALVRGDVNLFG